ncbi:MAG TPA: hypothetical protein VFW50_37200 [Streptosporangiaceae bacterium]|nr:hypothetical protein [Streptosporangiaceae bacterium]
MGGSGRDADVIASGREPREPGERARRAPGLAWLLAGALAVALAVAVTAAVRYGAEAGRSGHGVLPAASRAAALPLPQVTSTTLRLPARGGVAGTVVITAAAMAGAGRAQFTVSAVITGGTPGTVYDLIGNDCSDVSPLPDKVWATGLAGADGRADLTGYAWTGAVADRYWMTLDPAPDHPPGLHGRFARGQAASFPAGQGPCADR